MQHRGKRTVKTLGKRDEIKNLEEETFIIQRSIKGEAF